MKANVSMLGVKEIFRTKILMNESILGLKSSDTLQIRAHVKIM